VASSVRGYPNRKRRDKVCVRTVTAKLSIVASTIS
jgi:hypothetical protein